MPEVTAVALAPVVRVSWYPRPYHIGMGTIIQGGRSFACLIQQCADTKGVQIRDMPQEWVEIISQGRVGAVAGSLIYRLPLREWYWMTWRLVPTLSDHQMLIRWESDDLVHIGPRNDPDINLVLERERRLARD